MGHHGPGSASEGGGGYGYGYGYSNGQQNGGLHQQQGMMNGGPVGKE